MKTPYEKLIRSTLRDLLLEKSSEKSQEDDPEKEEKKEQKDSSSSPEIMTKGAFGSGGRSKAFVADAKSRAEKDPKGLLRDLGITSPPGGSSDLDKVLRILNAAIHSNKVMSQAYMGATLSNDRPQMSNEAISAVGINLGGIDRKNGTRFLAHTLRAAKNAGFLSLKNSIQFARGSSFPIIIVSA